MTKVMYVTMGTSLFHSATWDADETLRRESFPYTNWLTDEAKKSPERRMGSESSERIRRGLKQSLNLKNAADWAKRLPKNLLTGNLPVTTPMRYCAELSTLLKLAEATEGLGDLQELLNSYQEIRLIYDRNFSDSEGFNLPAIAAEHLAAYLHAIAGRSVAQPVSEDGISSRDPRVLLEALGTFRSGLQSEQRSVDLVISGGYKIYGMLLAPLAGERLRLLYIHESSEELVIYSDGEARIDEWTTERRFP